MSKMNRSKIDSPDRQAVRDRGRYVARHRIATLLLFQDRSCP